MRPLNHELSALYEENAKRFITQAELAPFAPVVGIHDWPELAAQAISGELDHRIGLGDAYQGFPLERDESIMVHAEIIRQALAKTIVTAPPVPNDDPVYIPL